jgi:hypothetical protein
MGAGGSKDKAGSKLQGAALEKGTGKKAGQAPTSLDAIAAKTARVSPEPTTTATGVPSAKTARVSPEPTGTAESNEAVPSTARRKSQDLLAAASSNNLLAPPKPGAADPSSSSTATTALSADKSPRGSDASESQRRIAPLSPASSGREKESLGSSDPEATPSSLKRDPERRNSWDRAKGFISGAISHVRKSSKETKKDGDSASPSSIESNKGPVPIQVTPAVSSEENSRRPAPVKTNLGDEDGFWRMDSTRSMDSGFGPDSPLLPSTNLRYRIEPMLAFGGERGKLEQLGDEVVYPATPGLDLQLVAINETPVRRRTLPGTAEIKHMASSPACLVLHRWDGQFTIYKPNGQIADLDLNGSGNVKALAVGMNGNSIGAIVEDPPQSGVRYIAISVKGGDGKYGEFQRSPKLPTKTTQITLSRAGVAVCICDQVATFWSPRAGDDFVDFEWSSDITAVAFFENDDPLFKKSVGERAGRIILGCSDVLEVKSDYTLASTHLTGKVSKLVVLKDAVVCSRADHISVYDLHFSKLTDIASPGLNLRAWGTGQYVTYGWGLLQWGAWDATPKQYGAMKVRDVSVCDAHVVLAGAKISVYHCSPEPVLEMELDIQASLVDISVTGAFAMFTNGSIEVRKGLSKRKIQSRLASVEVEDPADECCALAFSSEGHYLALAGRSIYVYSVAAGYALARVVHRQVEAFDWSRGERYLRYRANGESAAWDLKRDEDSDFDDKWVTATTALEENLASCFVGTDVAHATSGGGFMIAGDDGDDQVILRRGCQAINALAASRNPLGGGPGGHGGAQLSPAMSPTSPRGTWRVLVSVSSQGTIIFWKSCLNKGFEPSPSVSPVPFSPKEWSAKDDDRSPGSDDPSPYSIVPNPKPKRGTAVAM